jgi:hypothetical protein
MNWQSTFEAYPDADEIFVAGGMPFLTRAEAASHLTVAREGEVTKVTRTEAFSAEVAVSGEDGTTASAGESGEGGTTASAGESGEGGTTASAGESGTQAASEPGAKKTAKPNKK